MSQYRKGKGLSLGQTVNRLRGMEECLPESSHDRTTVKSALYHIEKLRAKLHRLNLKIQREAKIVDTKHNCKLPFSFCLDCMYHNACVRENKHREECS